MNLNLKTKLHYPKKFLQTIDEKKNYKDQGLSLKGNHKIHYIIGKVFIFLITFDDSGFQVHNHFFLCIISKTLSDFDK